MAKKNEMTKEDFDEKLRLTKYEIAIQCLRDVLKTEIKDEGGDIDYIATCSIMKGKARLSIDFIDSLDKDKSEM